jgi:uncharacterized Rossmann fold enzyme
MEFDSWNPVYERILDDFGFDRSADEHARDVLAGLVADVDPDARFDSDRLDEFDGQSVAIAGAAPCLADELAVADDADLVVAASTAADVLRDGGVTVDWVVTDLDKNPDSLAEMSHAGVPVVAHAHGDNVPAVREWVPQFASEQLLATTQAEPVPGVYNFGGFTDGDRAAFLADACGAADLRFLGWDFDDPTVDPMKAQKLAWAERLLYWLETRRGERFSVLDGRRASLTLPTE